MTEFCAQRGIQQRHSAPYSQFMDHTAERNMRTVGEMMTTTMLHANLPKRAWGFAAIHAAEVINRTAESAASNKIAGVGSNFSRLERWKGKPLPGQTKVIPSRTAAWPNKGVISSRLFSIQTY